MGGLVARELARVAAAGDRVTVGDWEFEVESVDADRLKQILAERVAPPVALTPPPPPSSFDAAPPA